MFAFLSRGGRMGLAVAIISVAACVDRPNPTQPAVDPGRPQFAVGDMITVTNTSGGSDVGSLQWALNQTTGGETIVFDPGLAGDTIFLKATLQVPHLVLIDGPKDKGITISAAGKFRVMDVYAEGARLRNLGIKDGTGYDDLGGIWSQGPLTLEHTTVWGNVSDLGAIFATGDVTLINSTVGYNNGVVTSGIAHGGKLTLINSTVAYNGGGPGLRAVTVSQGVTPTLVLRNSLVSNNGTPTKNCYYPFGVGVIANQGRNLANDATCGDSGVMIAASTYLTLLQNRGGPSPTFGFEGRSLALDNAVNCSVTDDQRYVARTSPCDIGAYEFTEYVTLTLSVDPTLYVSPTDASLSVTGTVKCVGDATFDVPVDVKQEQKAGKAPIVVAASGTTSIDCHNETVPWSVRVVPATGGFQNGSAIVSAQTTKTEKWVKPSATTATVKVVWAKK